MPKVAVSREAQSETSSAVAAPQPALSSPSHPIQTEEASTPSEAPIPLAPAAVAPAVPSVGSNLNIALGPPRYWPSSPFSGPSAGAPLANYGVVEEGVLYRSAVPDDAGYTWLLGRGFKSTVSLIGETGDRSAAVLDRGFSSHLWLDITDEHSPTDEQGVRFLQFVADQKNWPILVHCKVGLGRTGTMISLVRYTFDRWPMEKAIDEARIYRGGKDLDKRQMSWLREWAASHPQK